VLARIAGGLTNRHFCRARLVGREIYELGEGVPNVLDEWSGVPSGEELQ
jgi:hypothetical protein